MKVRSFLLNLTLIGLISGCASNQNISSDSPINKLFFQRLKDLAGPDATGCGVVPKKDPSRPDMYLQSRAIKCSNQSLAIEKPFWSAFSIPMFEDSSIWEGVALKPDGTLVKLTYRYDLFDPDMEISGGVVDEHACRGVSMDSGVGSVVVCEVEIGSEN